MYITILQILATLQIPYVKTEHEPVYNAQDVIHNLDFIPEHESKSLVITVKERIYVITIPASNFLTPTIVEAIAGVKKFHMLHPKLILEMLGVPVGAVAPFGYEKDIHCYVASSFLDQTAFNFNPGRHEVTFQVDSRGLKKLSEKGFLQFFS